MNRIKSPFMLIGILSILLPLLLSACSGHAVKPDKQTLISLGFIPIPEENEFPDISFINMDGETEKLSDFRGQVILLNFWASWCPPCRGEMPSMDVLSEKLKDYEFQMLPVNVQESRDMVDSFIGEFGTGFPVFLDPGGNAAGTVGIRALPTSLLIDKNGHALAVVTGAYEWDREDFVQMMREWAR